jgi:NADH-quinone oxidoreductase subunit L/multicomponent Na+:H+ antiporter subunit D
VTSLLSLVSGAETSLLPLVAVVVPFAVVVPILASGARPNRREAWTFAATLLTLAAVAAMVPAAVAGEGPSFAAGHLVAGVPFALEADAAGTLFALLAAGLWVVASVYSVGYVRSLGERDQTRYFAAFAASVGSALGVALAANLLTLFVFYELLTVATYPLVTHHADAESRRSGRKYLAYTLTGGVAVLAGTLLVYDTAGTLSFVPGGLAGAAADPVVGRAALALLVVGFAVKAAVMPLHGWLPDAMVAPTPVSGLLHAVAVVKSGVFGLARVLLFVFGPDAVRGLGVATPLAAAAAATMVLSGVFALRQDKLKRGLAYSTVSQLSYIVLGLAVLTPTAVFGAFLHLVAHAVMKITLFFVAGTLYVETGTQYLSEIGGVARRMPATMLSFAVGSAGLVGLPGVAGFVSKTYLVLGTLSAGEVVLTGALLVAGLLKLLFLWPIVLRAYAGDDAVSGFGAVRAAAHDGGHGPEDGGHGREWERRGPLREGDPRLVVPLAATALAAVVLGVAPDATPFWDLASTVAAEVFASG